MIRITRTERTPLGDRVRTEIRYDAELRRLEEHITLEVPPLRLALEPESHQHDLPELARHDRSGADE